MNTAQVKHAIKKTARQIQNEPLEILKSAAKQVTGDENIKLPWEDVEVDSGAKENTANTNDPNNRSGSDEKEYKKKLAEQEGRRLQALESELRDIRRQKIYSELMKRIQSGEDVPLEEFTELSFEQKDVLKAQMEAVKKQQSMQQASQSSSLPEPAAKRGRQMSGGQKGAAKKEQTRVEKPVPPSG